MKGEGMKLARLTLIGALIEMSKYRKDEASSGAAELLGS